MPKLAFQRVSQNGYLPCLLPFPPQHYPRKTASISKGHIAPLVNVYLKSKPRFAYGFLVDPDLRTAWMEVYLTRNVPEMSKDALTPEWRKKECGSAEMVTETRNPGVPSVSTLTSGGDDSPSCDPIVRGCWVLETAVVRLLRVILYHKKHLTGLRRCSVSQTKSPHGTEQSYDI